MEPVGENPLDKISKMESQQASGKLLNEEQLLLLSTKASVDRSLAELDPIRTQLEELAKEQVALILATEPAVTAVAATASEEPIEQKLQDPVESELVLSTLPLTEQVSAGSQCDDWKPHTKTKETMTETANLPPPVTLALADTSAAVTAAVNRLLQVLHVCAAYPRITGQQLSPALDYFGKTLLGLTSIAGFTATLQLSLRSASLYLDESSAESDEIISGVTYSALGATVSQLVAELSTDPDSDSGGPALVFMAPPNPLLLPATASVNTPTTPAPISPVQVTAPAQIQVHTSLFAPSPSAEPARTEQVPTSAEDNTASATTEVPTTSTPVDPSHSTDPSLIATSDCVADEGTSESKPRSNYYKRNNKSGNNTNGAYSDWSGRVNGRGRGLPLQSREKDPETAFTVTAVATSLDGAQPQARLSRERKTGIAGRGPGRGYREREGYQQGQGQQSEPTQDQELRERRPRRPAPSQPISNKDGSQPMSQPSHDPVSTITTAPVQSEDGEGWRSTNRPTRKESGQVPARSQMRPRVYNSNCSESSSNGVTSSDVTKTSHLAGRGYGLGTQSGSGTNSDRATTRQAPRPRTVTDKSTSSAAVQTAH